MTEWISCKDRLPTEYDYVLVFCNLQGAGEPKPISIVRMINGQWDLLSNDFTGYWQDLECTIYQEHIN